MRAIIRIILENVADERVIEIKKKVQELVKDVPKAEVEVTMMA